MPGQHPGSNRNARQEPEPPAGSEPAAGVPQPVRWVAAALATVALGAGAALAVGACGEDREGSVENIGGGTTGTGATTGGAVATGATTGATTETGATTGATTETSPATTGSMKPE